MDDFVEAGFCNDGAKAYLRAQCAEYFDRMIENSRALVKAGVIPVSAETMLNKRTLPHHGKRFIVKLLMKCFVSVMKYTLCIQVNFASTRRNIISS